MVRGYSTSLSDQENDLIHKHMKCVKYAGSPTGYTLEPWISDRLGITTRSLLLVLNYNRIYCGVPEDSCHPTVPSEERIFPSEERMLHLY